MFKGQIAVIGTGRVGSVLALNLQKKGYTIAAVYNRTLEKAQWLAAKTGACLAESPIQAAQKADLILLTVADRAISPVSGEIAQAGGYRPGQLVLHTSGACLAAELTGAALAGAYPLSFHPLQTFADREKAELAGCYFALEGAEEACLVGEQLTADLGGKFWRIKAEDKVLYHAGACVVSNYLVSLLNLAEQIYQRLGLSREEIWPAVTPLLEGTWHNIQQKGSQAALTGPISRGDEPTIAQHLQALPPIGEAAEKLYRQLGVYTLELAKPNLTADSVAKLQKLLVPGGD